MTRLLALVVTLTSLGCASTGATPRPFPVPGGSPPAVEAPTEPAAPPGASGAHGEGYAIAGTALALRGVPYRNGGQDPGGFDCSGFVYYVFGQHGIQVPRTVTEQFQLGQDAGARPEAGDLVFFSTVAAGPSHVGIVIGGDEFVHAPSSTGQVRVEHLSSTYWTDRYVGARRVR
jgi:peptidoglycan DL-endopeptidase CwlO